MPGKLVSRFCREQGIATVTSRWRNYYIALGRIDYLTDEPLAVVEDDGRTLKILFANERIRDIYSRDGVTDLHDWERRLNAHGSPVHSLHRDFVDNQLHEVGDTQTLTYPSGGHYMLLTAQVVARCENRSIYRASLQYVQIDAEEENQRRADMLRNLFYVFRDVALIDFSDDSVEGLKSSLSDQPIGKVARVKGVQLVFDTWTTEFVYPEDRARFRDFARADTFIRRLKRSAGGMLHGYFRSKNVDGSYTWLHHVVICVPRTNFEQLLYATVETGMDLVAFYRVITGERGGAAELAGSFAANAASEITDHALWRSLIEGSFVKYFWKDRQRRFLGVSQKFLEFYGLDSERDVLGKTDEEMGWHIDAEPFMQDELDVIERGKVIKNVKGRCVVRGRVHDIIVNKVPVYRDGKIVGLIGHFIDAEDLEKSDGDAMRFLVEDPVTGVANTRGFIEGLSGYLEELWSGGVRFAVMSVFVRGYDEFVKAYGRKAGDVLLTVVANALRGVFSTHAVIGRFANSQFFVLQQYGSEQEVHDSAERVRSSVRGIHRAGEWPCTCTAVVNVHLAKGGAGSDALFASMLTGLIDSMPAE
ncbi:MAG: diguanylate cyclase [Coriobacteriales bacterium]|nr:diguanylate cyclase [Coriobacteriales bacterium]